MLVRLCSKSCMWGFSLTWTENFPDIRAGFKKGRGTRDQIANIRWIMEKAREFQKNINLCFIDYAEAFDCVHHNKLWKTLKEMGIPDYLTCLIPLYGGCKGLLMRMKEESEKVDLKLNIQKTKIMASGHITLWQMMRKQWKQWQDFIFFGSIITVDGDCSQETCSLEEKQWPT